MDNVFYIGMNQNGEVFQYNTKPVWRENVGRFWKSIESDYHYADIMRLPEKFIPEGMVAGDLLEYRAVK